MILTEQARQPARLRIAVITCAVLHIEIEHFARDMNHIACVEVLEQGLHNEPPKLRIQLQQAIDRVERQADVEAIALGYGLCSRGTEGVSTRRCKLVIARAHDCITHLLGDKDRYARYVARHPGTYWYSPGWNRYHIPPGRERYEKLYQQYVEKYGEDNARFLMEAEQQWFTSYSQATYVEMGIGDTERDMEYTQRCAKWLNWSFDHQRGDPSLLLDLLLGHWDDARFVVLSPGQTIRMTADERIVEVVSAGRPDAR